VIGPAWAPGDKVSMHGDIDATVVGVSFSGHWTYNVAWVADGKRNAEWVQECEMLDPQARRRIEFGPRDNS